MHDKDLEDLLDDFVAWILSVLIACAFVVFVAPHLFASVPSRLACPDYGDPTLATAATNVPATYSSGAVDLLDAYFPGGYSAFTVVLWARVAANVATTAATGFPVTHLFFSAADARPTTKGGAELTPILLTNGTGNASWTSTMQVPEGQFRGGTNCYCLNLKDTTAAVTLAIGGDEWTIPATNKWIVNYQTSVANPTITLTTSGSWTFGYALNPLVKFYDRFNGTHSGTNPTGGYVTNGWTLCSFRIRITGDNVYTRDDLLPWGVELASGEERCAGSTDRATFAAGHQVRLGLGGIFVIPGQRYQVYGLRVYRGWLPDDLIESMRDRDMSEMQRRGFTANYK